MNFYNILNGVNINSFLIYPMLGFGNPNTSTLPRFRDCFVEDKKILVLARMGGGNRECYCESYKLQRGECIACIADEIEQSDECISRIDDSFDSTYCTFKFKVPLKWKHDFKLIMDNKIKETSLKYKKLVLRDIKSIELRKKIKTLINYNP